MPKVLVFGSMNIDYVYRVDHFVKKGETLTSKSLAVFPGGKGVNQSIAFAKAGLEVYIAGQIGEDGRFLLETLDAAGVNHDGVRITAEERTGNAIIQNDDAGDNCILAFPGANFRITEEMIDAVLAGFEAGDYLVLQNEINSVEEIAEKASEKGMIVVLNPSPVNERITPELLASADWLFVNEVEAAQIVESAATGDVTAAAVQETAADQEIGEEDREDAAADNEVLRATLQKQFPGKHIVLTLGEQGADYLYDGICFHQDIFPVKVVDTTAAGDTFTGYFLAGWMRGRAPQECLRLAARASAIAVSRPGAAPSIPEAAELSACS